MELIYIALGELEALQRIAKPTMALRDTLWHYQIAKSPSPICQYYTCLVHNILQNLPTDDYAKILWESSFVMVLPFNRKGF